MIAWTKFGKWKKEAVQWMGGGKISCSRSISSRNTFHRREGRKKNEKKNGEEWTGQALDVEL